MYDSDSSTSKLFLGGLHAEANEDDIRAYFGQFGKVTDVIVMRDSETRMSRRFGFVTFSTQEECMNCFNSKPHSVRESVVDVKLALPKGARQENGGGFGGGGGGYQQHTPMRRVHPDSDKKLFVGGLSHASTNESLKSYFSRFGEIIDAIVLKHPETNRPRGFGFVTFISPSCIDAVQAARPHTVDTSTVETKRAVPKDEAGPKNCTKIFIGGVKEDMNESHLQSYFSNFGVVTKIDIKVDKETGRKRGFGFIDFEDYDAVDKLLLTGQHIINDKNIDVKKAVPREDQHGGGGMGGGGGNLSNYGYGSPVGRGRGAMSGAGSYGAQHGSYASPQGWGGSPYGGGGGGAAASAGYGSGGYGGAYGANSASGAASGWDGGSWQQQQPQHGAGAASGWSDPQSAQAGGGWGSDSGYGRSPAGAPGPMRSGVGRGGAVRTSPYTRGNSAAGSAYSSAARGGAW